MSMAVSDRLLQIISHSGLSRLVGRSADLKLPRPLLRVLLQTYVTALGIDLEETARPLSSFESFDDFFTRALRPGARPIAPGERVATSPVDSRVMNTGVAHDGQLFQVKGSRYSAADLLGDAAEARKFNGGSYITLYLSPADYHRIHAPLDGEIHGFRYVPGRLYPVNELGMKRVPRLFTHNERLTTYLKTALGLVAVVKVGATSVGRITVSYTDTTTNQPGGEPHALFYARPKRIAKGDELGRFHLGSTVVLLFEPPALAFGSHVRPDRLLRVGQRLT